MGVPLTTLSVRQINLTNHREHDIQYLSKHQTKTKENVQIMMWEKIKIL